MADPRKLSTILMVAGTLMVLAALGLWTGLILAGA
jgi:hypothetical protein